MQHKHASERMETAAAATATTTATAAATNLVHESKDVSGTELDVGTDISWPSVEDLFMKWFVIQVKHKHA